MAEITYQMFLSTLQTVGILVGIVYYLIIMRNSQRNQALALKAQEQALETRQAQMIMQIDRDFKKPETMGIELELLQMRWEDLDDFFRKYDSSVNPDNYAKRFSYWYGLNSIGILLRKGLIDVDAVHDLIGDIVLLMWNRFESVIKEIRRRHNFSDLLEAFEYLYYEMFRIKEQRGKTFYNIIKPIADSQRPELKT